MKKAIAATTIMVWQPVPSNIDGLNAASNSDEITKKLYS